jgi:hypothetical protein
MAITPTQLRANLYKVLDQVIETKQPIAINRNGQIIKLVLEPKKNHGKLANLTPHPNTLCVDPENIVQMDWSSHWQGDKNL